MTVVNQGLYPQLLWDLFKQICSIPHGSKHELALSEHITGLAHNAGLIVQKDSTGNLCIKVPATKGYEKAPSVVLQAHLDMVCEKNNDSNFNFLRDKITLQQDGDWIKSFNTSLGADNGIGVAAALTVAFSTDISHGPLEILLTVDEETGLTGAMGLSSEFIKSTILINLDSERSNTVCIGCAGGGGITTTLDLEYIQVPDTMIGVELKIDSLQGGHSGLNIHENRANAIKLLIRIINSLKTKNVQLAYVNGGDKHNAIPREAIAVLCIHAENLQYISGIINSQLDAFKNEYPNEKNIHVSVKETEPPHNMLTEKCFTTICNMLLAFPSGVLAMSRIMSGLVETSNNLSSVNTLNNLLKIHNTPRSSVSECLQATIQQLIAISKLAGATWEEEPSYQGWQPNTESKILRLFEETYQNLYGQKPEREATHAGLECGIIGEKYKNIDMISFGPDIINCHSPAEAVSISSVSKFWKTLCSLLIKIAEY